MNALIVIAGWLHWLREHWIGLVAALASILIITGIAFLPLPWRKAVLIILAIGFLAASTWATWQARQSGLGSEGYDGLALIAVAVLAALGTIAAGVWAGIIW